MKNAGAIQLTVSGSVTNAGASGAAYAIHTKSSQDGTATITLSSGAWVIGGKGTTAVGTAILDDNGKATVTVNSGAVVSGTIELGGGDDSLTFSGADFSRVTRMDGGEGTDDTLNFTAASGELSANQITGWEKLKIGSGATIGLSGALSDTALTLSTGGTLDIGDDTDITDTLTVSAFDGGGTIMLNADFVNSSGNADKVIVSGNVTGVTTLSVTGLGNLQGQDYTQRPEKIEVVKVNGSAPAGNAFTFAGRGLPRLHLPD